MAKVGEGDKRWIVSERPDGANVNAWHWSEKNVTSYWVSELKAYVNDILFKCEDQAGLEVGFRVSTATGEISVYNRKGRQFPVFDLQVEIEWEARKPKSSLPTPTFVPLAPLPVPEPEPESGDAEESHFFSSLPAEVKGKITIIDLSPDSIDDFEHSVSVDTNTDIARRVKEEVRRKAIKVLKKELTEWVVSMKQSIGDQQAPTTPRQQPQQQESEQLQPQPTSTATTATTTTTTTKTYTAATASTNTTDLHNPSFTSPVRPICTVGDVFPGSPADLGGLRKGDLIVRVGGVMSTSSSTFVSVEKSVIPEIQKHENRALELEVSVQLAKFETKVVVVVPKSWSPGKGLLGCMLDPI